MRVLRFLSAALLALWLGGLMGLGGVAAPAIFSVLEMHDAAGGRTLAGTVFGAIFQDFQRAAVAGGLALGLILVVRRMLGASLPWFAGRLSLLAVMLGVSIYTSYVIAPRIDTIRETTPVAIASLAPTDPVRVEFGRLHGASNGLMLLTVLLGTTLLWFEIDPDTRK